MKRQLKIACTIIIIGLCSCYSIRYGSSWVDSSTSETLYIVNGSNLDLKWYSKDFYSDQTQSNRYSYTWFIEAVTHSRSYNSKIDSTHFIGVNYTDSTDTLFNSILSRQDLIQKRWKLIVGDQSFEKKLVLLKWPDTLKDVPLEFNNGISQNGYFLFYRTNKLNICYGKFFNNDDVKIAEGPLLPDLFFKNKKSKRKYGFEPVGVWKYYDANKLIDIDTIPFRNIEDLILVDRKNNDH